MTKYKDFILRSKAKIVFFAVTFIFIAIAEAGIKIKIKSSPIRMTDSMLTALAGADAGSSNSVIHFGY